MAKTEQPEKMTMDQALAKNKIPFGSPAHIRLLETGYGMSVEKAKTIVKERKENPQLWPYDLWEKAVNLLQAIDAVPVVIDQTPGWHRERAEQ